MKFRLAIIAFAALAVPHASAQRIDSRDRPFMAAGLAEDIVEVKVNYSGSRIVLFATAPQPENETSGMAVALIGPMAPQKMIHRTAAGDQTIEFVAAPLVFAVGAEPQVAASVAPGSDDRGRSQRAGLGHAAIDPADVAGPQRVARRLRRPEDGAGSLLVRRHDDRAPRRRAAARQDHPADLNAPPGEYRIRAVSFRNGAPVGESEQVLTLVRSGLDATLFDLSRQHGFIYGFLAVLLGVSVGGIAAWFGRK
jgi:hypothetical protein